MAAPRMRRSTIRRQWLTLERTTRGVDGTCVWRCWLLRGLWRCTYGFAHIPRSFRISDSKGGIVLLVRGG
jgi:hypothetical protein